MKIIYKLFILAAAIGFSAVIVPFFLPKAEDKQLLKNNTMTNLGESLDIPSEQAINKIASSISERESDIKADSQTAKAGAESASQKITEEVAKADQQNQTTMPYQVELPTKDLEAVIETSLGN